MFRGWKVAQLDDPAGGLGQSNQELANLLRDHVRLVLSSAPFAASKRAQEFLQFVVEYALADHPETLKERIIGAEMFGRPIDYDTANDAVVRVLATDVRRRLTQFYQGSGPEHPVRIELPTGSYMPKFVWQAEKQADTTAPFEPSTSGQTSQARAPAHITSFAIVLLSAAAVLFAAAIYFLVQLRENSSTFSRIHSIAILPLVDTSGDPAQEYFADGMTEELIAELGQVPTLRVISRTSSMTYKGTKKSVPEIARELRVDGIVEGSVMRGGQRVRITTHLIDSKSDRQIWARSYERDMSNVLDLQRDVARAITEGIRVELSPQQQANSVRSQPVKPEAMELYLQGTQQMNAGNARRASELFQQSIDRDPNYAAAHAGLAAAYGRLGEGGAMPYAEAFSQQKEEALKAIELDDSRPEPHLELGLAAMNQNWDWTTQEKELQRAMELNPNAAAVRWAYADYLSRVGLTKESIAQADRALQLDPVSSAAYMHASFVDYYARQYDEALAYIQRGMALHPDPEEMLFPLGIVYVQKGQLEKAIQEFQKIGDSPHALGHLGNAFARLGRKQDALAVVKKLREHIEKTGIGRYEVALIYAGLGEKDHAFEWLNNAYQVRDKGLTFLRIDPCLDPLRSDLRFNSLLQRVGFPPN